MAPSAARTCRQSALARLGRRVFPIKGGSLTGRPLVERPSIHNRYRVKLFLLCVDTGKDIVLSRLRIPSPGPGFVHLPEVADEEYLAQLTAEKVIRKYVKGRGAVREWVKLRERNEALDLEVYALAGLYILGPAFVRSLPERAARFAVPVKGEPSPEPVHVQVRLPVQLLRHRRGGWVNSWRYHSL